MEKVYTEGKPFNILCVTGDYNASTQLRIISPLRLLEKDGLINKRVVFLSKKKKFDVRHIQWADIIILQRVRSRRWLKILNHAQKNNKAAVFEIDDNMLEIPKGHPEYGFLNKIKNKKFIQFMRRVDCVTVSTRVLKDSFSKYSRNIKVLPNYIDKEFFDFACPKRAQREELTIGYAGNITHKPDIEAVIPAIKKILDEFPAKVQFKFFGYLPDDLIDCARVQCVDFISDYRTYLQTLYTSEIDFAIAPLKDNIFNRCKSSIKFLEYSTAGIPGVFAHVTPYTEIVSDKETGIIVSPDTSEAWYEAMKLLIMNEVLRERIAQNCYAFVNKYFLLQDNFAKWFEVYSSLLKAKNNRSNE